MSDTNTEPGAHAPNPDTLSRTARTRTMLERLRDTWPAIFPRHGNGALWRPLATGAKAEIARALHLAAEDLDALGNALAIHAGSAPYLEALAQRVRRVHLDGSPADEVTPEHAGIAAEKLAAKRAVRKARRQRQAEQRREREAKARKRTRTEPKAKHSAPRGKPSTQPAGRTKRAGSGPKPGQSRAPGAKPAAQPARRVLTLPKRRGE